jgi:hypothetical protein
MGTTDANLADREIQSEPSLEHHSLHIAELITELELIVAGRNVFEACVNFEKWIYDTSDCIQKSIKTGIKLLRSSLFEEILQSFIFKESLEWIREGTSHGRFYSSTIHTALAVIAWHYKAMVLRNLEKQVEKLKAKVASGDSLFQKHGESLQIWERKIQQDKAKLEAARLRLNLKTMKNGISILSDISKSDFFLNQSFPLSGKIQEFLHQYGGPAADAIAFILKLINMQDAKDPLHAYNNRVNAFEEWRANTQACVLIDQTQPIQGAIPRASSVLNAHIHIETTRDFEAELDLFLQQNSWDAIQAQFTTINYFLSPFIEDRENLLIAWSENLDFKNELLACYTHYCKRQLQLHYFAGSKNLLERREARLELRIAQLRPRFQDLVPDLLKLRKPYFESIYKDLLEKAEKGQFAEVLSRANELNIELPPGDILQFFLQVKNSEFEYDHLFRQWFFNNSEAALRHYVDHQATLSESLKGSFKQLLQEKQQVEGKFLKFRYGSALTTTTSLTLMMGIKTIFYFSAFAGSGPLLLVLGYWEIFVNYGIIAGNLYLNCKYRSTSFNLASFSDKSSIIYKKCWLRYYEHVEEINKAKERKMTQSIARLALMPNRNQADEENYQKQLAVQKLIQAEYEISMDQALELREKIQELEDVLTQKAWQDFENYHHLSSGMNPNSSNLLASLQEALSDCNLALLDPEIESLLAHHLKLDLQTINKNPAKIKKALQDFFTLGDSKVVVPVNLSAAPAA